ncbi:MAG: hypothetical protein SGJ27_14065 [Candidatus Melainabacteria bacterium]|nr:hypothetical protein [Candidatus Melainabacteria bacterium]
MSLFVSVIDDTDEELIPSLEEAVALSVKEPKLVIGTNVDGVQGESIGSYGNLHKLRGFAAHIEFNGGTPTVEDQAANYPLLRNIYEGELITKQFQHLIEHSDSDGFYLPIDFAEPFPLVIDETLNSCGSSFQLLNELNQIGPVLFGDSLAELKGPEIFWTLDDFDPWVVEKLVWTRLRWLVRNANKQNLVMTFG